MADTSADIILKTPAGLYPVEVTLVQSPDLPMGYEQRTIDLLPPRQPTGAISYQQVDPEIGLSWPQTSWHRGFGVGVVVGDPVDFSEPTAFTYGYSERVLAMFRNELILGYAEDQVDIILQNGRFEAGTTGWTTDGVLTAITAGGRTDDAISTAGSTYVQHAYTGTVSVLQSREVTFGVYVSRLSGTGTAKARITDDGGDDDSATSSAATYSLLEVTATIDAAATAVTFKIILSESTDVWRIDDAFVIPTGGVAFSSPPVHFLTDYYMTSGRGIYKWSEADDVFTPVYLDAAYAVNSLEVFSVGGTPYLMAGRGTSANYIYSTSGSAGSWTSPTTPTGDPSKADWFARVQERQRPLRYRQGARRQRSVDNRSHRHCELVR